MVFPAPGPPVTTIRRMRESLKDAGEHSLRVVGVIAIFGVTLDEEVLLRKHAAKSANEEKDAETDADDREMREDSGPSNDTARRVDRMANVTVRAGDDQTAGRGFGAGVKAAEAERDSRPQHQDERSNLKGDGRWRGREEGMGQHQRNERCGHESDG